jgi:leucyl aminopeptidase
MIELMKFDMGGAAAVFGCAKAIAQLRPKVNMSGSDHCAQL